MDPHTPETDEYPLYDSLDSAILMHRDAHFGGKFEIMLDYYVKEGKGVFPDFTIDRINELHAIEQGMGQNLAAMILTGSDAEHVGKAKTAYKTLRDLYGNSTVMSDETLKFPRMIADLILSEEEHPKAEIDAIVAQKSAIVPALLKLVQSEEYYDPLFPGYGLAPALAAQCLGLIGDKRAIITLFESIGGHDFSQENDAISALKAIGEPAKEFLLHVLHASPITYDNERAAVALLNFKEDSEVSKKCFNMLKELDLKKHSILATHLILICEGLKDSKARKEFEALANAPKTPSSLKRDILAITKHW